VLYEESLYLDFTLAYEAFVYQVATTSESPLPRPKPIMQIPRTTVH
jgi:hypothetical protein